MKKPIYLAKSGKISGPFSREQADQLQESGEILQYSWIWDETREKWTPIDPPPPYSPDSNRTHKSSEASWCDGFPVVCFNGRNLINGSLFHVTDLSCSLKTSIHEDSPVFPPKSKITLNLYNPQSGNTINVMGSVFRISHHNDDGWIYQINWNGIPEKF